MENVAKGKQRHMEQRDGAQLAQQHQRPEAGDMGEGSGYPEGRRLRPALSQTQRDRKIGGSIRCIVQLGARRGHMTCVTHRC